MEKISNKPLTISGCCDNIEPTSGNTIIMFGPHRFNVYVAYCKSCGSTKATSHIKEMKEAKLGTANTGKIRQTA